MPGEGKAGGEGETEQAGDLATCGDFSNLCHDCAHTYDVGMQSESDNSATFFAKTNFRGSGKIFGIKQSDRR